VHYIDIKKILTKNFNFEKLSFNWLIPLKQTKYFFSKKIFFQEKISWRNVFLRCSQLCQRNVFHWNLQTSHFVHAGMSNMRHTGTLHAAKRDSIQTVPNALFDSLCVEPSYCTFKSNSSIRVTWPTSPLKGFLRGCSVWSWCVRNSCEKRHSLIQVCIS